MLPFSLLWLSRRASLLILVCFKPLQNKPTQYSVTVWYKLAWVKRLSLQSSLETHQAYTYLWFLRGRNLLLLSQWDASPVWTCNLLLPIYKLGWRAIGECLSLEHDTMSWSGFKTGLFDKESNEDPLGHFTSGEGVVHIVWSDVHLLINFVSNPTFASSPGLLEWQLPLHYPGRNNKFWPTYEKGLHSNTKHSCGGGHKGLRWCGYVLFLAWFSGNIYCNLQHCGFIRIRGL